MAPIKQNMYQHLRSAKEWLTKAEEAFDKQHDVRGELDLMLAQAELQHVKETNRSRQWRYKYLAFRHGLALTLAMFMVVVLGGVYWWTNKPVLAIPVPIAGQVNLPVVAVTKVERNGLPAIITKENSLPPVQQVANQVVTPLPSKAEPLQQSESPRQVKQPRQVEQPGDLSADEMQKLVRAAGKSLRGQ